MLLISETCFAGQLALDQQYQQASKLEEFKEISRVIRNILNKKPDQPGLEWRLARTHYAMAKREKTKEFKIHHYDLCIEHSSRALEMDPGSASSFFFRALCRGKQGELKGIWSSLGIIDPFKADMRKALELNPGIENGGPNRALGILYLELPFFLGGRGDQAVYHLEEAVRLGPDYAENYLGLAQAYYTQKNFNSARKSLLTLKRLTDNVANDEYLMKLRTKGRELMKKLAP